METWFKRERGSAWDLVAKSLNCQQGFNVNQRSIRDRFNTLARKSKGKNWLMKKEQVVEERCYKVSVTNYWKS